ncbi:hypothetical protein VE02_04173 [Pseudogymnoascus sp. 03VT05]|nr:hypothetical protein VE02_04173 [Pseudogymnoascus sp. 03VT05]
MRAPSKWEIGNHSSRDSSSKPNLAGSHLLTAEFKAHRDLPVTSQMIFEFAAMISTIYGDTDLSARPVVVALKPVVPVPNSAVGNLQSARKDQSLGSQIVTLTEAVHYRHRVCVRSVGRDEKMQGY